MSAPYSYPQVTLMVHHSFLRFQVHPTTRINPCYLYYISSICDVELDSNSIHHRDQQRKRKKWRVSSKETRESTTVHHELIEQKESTTIRSIETDHALTTTQRRPSFILLFLLILTILGLIVWYIFIKSTQSFKSIFRRDCENIGPDYGGNNNRNVDLSPSHSNETVDSLFLDEENDADSLQRKDNQSNNVTSNDYANIQILIYNIQQSDSHTIHASVLIQILSDLFQNAIPVTKSSSNSALPSDLRTFLSYTPQYIYILRTTLQRKYSCQPSNPSRFLQYQHVVSILHSLEMILEYLQRDYSSEKSFVLTTLTHLQRILSLSDGKPCTYRYISLSLLDVLQRFDRKLNSIGAQ